MQENPQPHVITYQGDVTVAALAGLRDLAGGNEKCAALHLDFAEADIADGAAMALLTATLKQLLAAGVHVTLHQPPQLVVHNLYRVGYYPHAQLLVESMRQDEAYS
jgi:ABC-type transporter Mla MlaB component